MPEPSPILQTILIALLLLLALLGAGLWARPRLQRLRLARRFRKGPSGGRQSCSYCRRKAPAKELAFYAGTQHVVGVCRQCRPQAERQGLLRL